MNPSQLALRIIRHRQWGSSRKWAGSKLESHLAATAVSSSLCGIGRYVPGGYCPAKSGGRTGRVCSCGHGLEMQDAFLQALPNRKTAWQALLKKRAGPRLFPAGATPKDQGARRGRSCPPTSCPVMVLDELVECGLALVVRRYDVEADQVFADIAQVFHLIFFAASLSAGSCWRAVMYWRLIPGLLGSLIVSLINKRFRQAQHLGHGVGRVGELGGLLTEHGRISLRLAIVASVVK